MGATYEQKLRLTPKRQSNGRVYWTTCQHTFYERGQRPYLCGADTVNGSHVCPDCKKLEAKTEGFQLRDLRLVQY